MDIRVGYVRCSHLTQELQSQLDALAGHGIDRDRIFAEKVSSRVRIRPKFDAALAPSVLAGRVRDPLSAGFCRDVRQPRAVKNSGSSLALLVADVAPIEG